MIATKPDTRTREGMKAGAPGEWKTKSDPVKGKQARRAAVAGAPKRKFANINGKRVEVRQARPKEARPYPSAPVNARPGSRIAAIELREPVENIPHLPFRKTGPYLPVGRHKSKAEHANDLPFMPEFIAEGRPFPRISRDKDGNALPRVRTDNGMTKQLQGRGIGRREDGKPTYTKRQIERMEAERQAQYAALMDQARYRQADQAHRDAREAAKRALMDAMGRKRDALARGDQAAADAAQAEIRTLRKTARFKG